MFATPPCPGQRRLAIVVAAAFTKCIVKSSFRVRGRNCSIGACWERKKFRTVMHMYARDLADLSMLVMTRVKDAHVHICVDAQTDWVLGYPVPPAVILALLQLLHIVPKNKDFSSVSSWNIC